MIFFPIQGRNPVIDVLVIAAIFLDPFKEQVDPLGQMGIFGPDGKSQRLPGEFDRQDFHAVGRKFRHLAGDCGFVIDADIGMANMALILGMDEVPVTLHEVLAGKADIEDAIYEGPAGVKVVPSGISLQGFQQADRDKLRDVMHKLVDRCEYLLIDAPSGISKEGVVPLSVADQVILVVNPELASMADALKTKILCEVMGGNVYGAILNRAGQEHTELRSQSVEDVLGVRVIDVVPEDASVRRAAAYKTPCVLKYPGTDASRAFKRIAAQMSGVEYEDEPGEPKQEGFVDRLARAVFR